MSAGEYKIICMDSLYRGHTDTWISKGFGELDYWRDGQVLLRMADESEQLSITYLPEYPMGQTYNKILAVINYFFR